ncbi:chaperonin 10-like protein [Flagelloscypha sp. PMI_526]|nr:chaperonin 10-like protein [Flagelloscypha sp. PMI_526]
MSSPYLPDTIKGLRLREDKETIDVVDVPFASREDVKNVPAGQVLLKVRAIGLNPIDWKSSRYSLSDTGGIIGCDAAGDVIAVGPEVTHLSAGDRAAGFTQGHGLKERPGAFSQYVLFAASGTFKIQDGQSYEEAAALPVPLLTAVQTLYYRHHLALPSSSSTTNTPVLIWGASTAVGHYAIQLANLSGYRVITTASPEVFGEIKALGASEVFDYKDRDTPQKIRNIAPDLTMALDTVSENGTTELVAASLSPTSVSNKIYSLLYVPPTISLPSNTMVEFTITYTLLGFPVSFIGDEIPVNADDVAGSLNFVKNEYPRLFNGGDKRKVKIQKLRLMSGGLENVAEGLRILKEGRYGREKLIYPIE